MEHPAKGVWVCTGEGQWLGTEWMVVEPNRGWSGNLTTQTEIIAYSSHCLDPHKSGLTWRGTWGQFVQLFTRPKEATP